MAKKNEITLTVDKTPVTVSNPGKLLFPESGITKREYVTFYRDVSKWALPHFHGRPISLERFPSGVGGERFFQKEIPDYFPDYFTRVEIEGDDGEMKPYGVLDKRASFVYVANMVGVIHTLMTCVDHLNRPDKIVWDMDPMEVGFEQVRAAARLFKYLLEELGLHPYVMTSGSRGLHVVVAIEPEHDTSDVFAFSKESSELIAQKLPQLFTTIFTKSKRGKRVFIDYFRNGSGQTAVGPYVVRAIEGGPISMPIHWEELDDEAVGPQTFTLRNAIDRLKQQGDAWADLYDNRDRLGDAMDRLKSMRSS